MPAEVTRYARGTEVRYGYAWRRGYGEIGGRCVAPDGRVRSYASNEHGEATIKVRGITVPGNLAYEFDGADDRYLVFRTDEWPVHDLEPMNPPEFPSALFTRLVQALGTSNAVPLPGASVCAVRVSDTAVGIRYHSTVIITLESDGRVIFDTGGWYTRTTMSWMNEYTPPEYNVAGMVEPHYSKSVKPNRHWVISRDGEPIFDDIDGNMRGVVIHPRGALIAA